MGPTDLDEDQILLSDAPRLFAIVASPDSDQDQQQVVAWGHELPDQAVLTWRLGAGRRGRDSNGGGNEVAVFRSAAAALLVAQLICPARLVWVR
jgi:hypothetical protein